jgi:hypothetical protein
MQNPETALAIYNEFRDKYPSHGLNKVLDEMRPALEKIKEKNVKVTPKKT